MKETTTKTMTHIRKQVSWYDLRRMSYWQILFNLFIPYPFLGLSWWCAEQSQFLWALLTSFAFFTACFRQSHDAFHQTLGLKQLTSNHSNKSVSKSNKNHIGKIARELLLGIMSTLLLTSTHAIRETHLQHHHQPLIKSDIEASFHNKPWYQAIIEGMPHWVAVQRQGFILASQNNRHKIICEYLSIAVVVTIAMSTAWQFLLYHIVVMCIANSLVGFVAGWAVHHDCDGQPARTERSWLINRLTGNLLYHLEHHLFPAVPSCNLPVLAKRLDAIAPQLQQKRVLTTPTVHTVINNRKDAFKNHRYQKTAYIAIKPLNHQENTK